ncbi:MAG: hypothetical protein ACI845_003075 [Gammaproteobacteria bacterium]|jgi:hypothetical protein
MMSCECDYVDCISVQAGTLDSEYDQKIIAHNFAKENGCNIDIHEAANIPVFSAVGQRLDYHKTLLC